MDVTIVKRNRHLQLSAIFTLGGKRYRAEAKRFLEGGKKEGSDSLDAFMEKLVGDADIDACFAAMEDRTDIDPAAELAEKLESGKTELVAQIRHFLEGKASQEGEIATEAQAMLSTLAPIGEVAVLEPAEGKGICRTCFASFDLHYIAGTNDLCMNHINPGFI